MCQLAIHWGTEVLLHEVNAPTAVVVKLNTSNIGSSYRYHGLRTGPEVLFQHKLQITSSAAHFAASQTIVVG